MSYVFLIDLIVGTYDFVMNFCVTRYPNQSLMNLPLRVRTLTFAYLTKPTLFTDRSYKIHFNSSTTIQKYFLNQNVFP